GDLERHEQRRPPLRPSGFVYHLSRCGSTFVTSALASVPGVSVLSEPVPLDQLLRLVADQPTDRQALAARWMLSALSPAADAGDDGLVVKLDSWHIHLFPILRRAYPDVPWIFLARDPVEVMVSHDRQRGPQMIPGALPSELLRVDAETVSLHEHGASVLAAILDSALFHEADGGLLVDYTELPEAITTRIQPHFGLAVIDPDPDVLSQHAKNPVLPFTPDGVEKRDGADPELREATHRLVGGAYSAFDAARTRQLASDDEFPR
ncbi:MAG: aspartyl beta-hydroxylase, partial [Ilumatobacter sp.]